MSVLKKLVLGFSIVVVITVILGIISITGMNILKANGQSMYENQVAGLESASNAALSFRQIRLDTQQAMVRGFMDDQKGVNDIQARIENNAQDFKIWLDQSRRLADAEELQQFNTAILQLFESEYLPQVREIIHESSADIPDHANKLFINVMAAHIDAVSLRIEKLLTGLVDYNSALAEQTSTNNALITQSFVISQIVLLLIAILVCAAAAFWVIRSITSPIAESIAVLTEMAHGNLLIQMKGNYSGEFLTVKNTLNDTIEKIRHLTLMIKQKASLLYQIGTDLSANMTQTAAVVNQITANIQNITGRVINQSASVTESNAMMTHISDNIRKLNGLVEKQTGNVSQSSAAIEEMLANIQSVTQTLIKNTDNVKELSSASEVGRNGLQEVAVDIQSIAKESEGLLEVNTVMQGIASQTNLLSMNAAIEAAHAGAAGKGFAVVADEIRKLAESSGEQSKTISTVLKKIKASIDKIMVSTENVLTRFKAIDSGVRTVSDQEENIRNAMEEQGQGSQLILVSVGQLNESTHLVKSSSDEMLAGSSEVVREGQSLAAATQDITGGMNEMAAGANQMNSAVQQANDLAGKTQENINLLVQELTKFRVE